MDRLERLFDRYAEVARPSFTGRCLSYGVGVRVWRIAEPFAFHSTALFDLEVPAGFLTDFASVPRILWPIIPIADGVYDPAAVVHDYAVRNRKRLGLSLMQCHGMFHEALRCRGTPLWKADTMFAAVVAFNWISPGPGDGTTPKRLLKRVRAELGVSGLDRRRGDKSFQ
ncbi:MAG: DUF1353 domain-containing protein [Verrucomicrobia bacterium]|nr:DUF1353 domain-containing protein [Verrucomicrobiota bacterium]